MEDIFEYTIMQSLLFGVMFLIVGLILYIFPPKKMNNIFAYRTAASMQSQECWDFSQNYAAKQRITVGMFMTVLSFAAKINPAPRNYEAGISFAALLFALIFIKVSTKRAIKKRFNLQ